MRKNSILDRLGIIGFSLGLFFPLFSITIDLILKDKSFSVQEIQSVFTENPLHFIILSAPVVLGGSFLFLSRKIFKEELENEKKLLASHKNTLQALLAYIRALGKGDFSVSVAADKLDPETIHTLHEFKETLMQYRAEESMRQWVAQHLASFADLLRRHENIDDLAYEIIKFISERCGFLQGGIFICEGEDNPQLVLKGCYAYQRKKYLKKCIEPGEGLVGQCFLEKEPILLYKVPDNYVHITSGLGEANPYCIVIYPLLAEEAVEGVIELAGFKKPEPYILDFIRRACESTAAVLRNVKNGMKMQRMVKELQQQTEMLRTQEEEMRQNAEELQAIQEQLTRQLDEHKILLDRLARRETVLNLTNLISETDLHGTIIFVNDRFCEVSGYRSDELIGRPHNIIRHPDMPRELFRLFWKTIKNGEVFRGIIKNKTKNGYYYWVDATVVPIKDSSGQVYKYVSARYHITDDEMAERLYEKQATKLQLPKPAPEAVDMQSSLPR